MRRHDERTVGIAIGILLAAAAVGVVRAQDASLKPVVVNTRPGPEYASTARPFQGIPGIERAPGGRLWATWYAGGDGEGESNYVVLTTSGDDGKTWSNPKLVVDPPGPVRAYDPCLWLDPDGRLHLFWAQSYQWWDGRSGVWTISADDPNAEAPAWSAPRRLCDGIMMNKPTVTSDGTWLLPVAVWGRPATADADHRRESSLGTGAHVVASTDRGATWTPRGKAVVPERAFDEHSLVERRDGSLWMLVRTKYGIGEADSTDGGLSWSEGRRSTIPHVDSRFFIRRLRSGKLLLVAHQPPEGKARSHLIARLSDDDGRTWAGGLMIDDRKGASYPDGVQDSDGRIRLIYDYNRTRDRQILMAVFTEDDVAAGRPTSADSRLRVVVDQASSPAK